MVGLECGTDCHVYTARCYEPLHLLDLIGGGWHFSEVYANVRFHPVLILHPVTIQGTYLVYRPTKRVFIMAIIKITNLHLLFIVLLVVLFPALVALPVLRVTPTLLSFFVSWPVVS